MKRMVVSLILIVACFGEDPPKLADPEPSGEIDEQIEPLKGDGIYRFETLTGKSHGEFRAFFKRRPFASQETRDDGELANDRLPEGFWEMEAKAAAMALAEKCRSEIHRKRYRLAIDESEGVEPPASGWYVYRYSSDGSYFFRGLTCALRYGVEEPFLLVREEDSTGMVGRNPWADESNFRVRDIALTSREADFLSGFFFWLERIQSSELVGSKLRSSYSTSADGYLTFAAHPDGGKAREIGKGTAWSETVESRWRNDYDRTVMINLVDRLIKEALYEKWPVRNSDENEGIRPRVKLVSSVRSIFQKDKVEPVPPEFLERLIAIVAEDGLEELQVEVSQLLKSISKKASKEEDELKELRERFARDHFGTPLRDDRYDHPKAYERKELLEKKLRFDRGRILRERLELAEKRLSLLGDLKRLETLAGRDFRDTEWALTMLRKRKKGLWIKLMMEKFHQKTQLRRAGIFTEIASVDPVSARVLISQMSEAIFGDLLMEITRFRQEFVPGKASETVPQLMAILRDKNRDKIVRIEAFELLSKLARSPKQEAGFRKLVIAEIKNPQTKDIYYSTEEAAFRAFEKLKVEDGDLEFLWGLKAFVSISPEMAIALIRSRVSDSGRQQKVIEMLVSHHFEHEISSIGRLAELCLVMNLREFAPRLQKLATIGGGKFDDQKSDTARYVTAFWTEQNSQTLAKMWIDFMASKTYGLESERFPNPELKKLAGEAVKKLPPPERARWIEDAIGHYYDFRWVEEGAAWLRRLK